MKKLITLLLSLTSTVLIAQIPNASFENWTAGSPDNWQVITAYLPTTVTQSSSAHAGTYAVQLNSVNVSSYYVGGVIETGTASGGYFLNSGNPVALDGWYKLNSVSGDELSVIASTKCPDDTANSGGTFTDTASTSVYKEFSVCLTYVNSCTADSASIAIALTNTGGFTHSGSVATVDDLSFGSCVNGIAPISNKVTLEKAYPNPASTTCNIIYSIPSNGTVSIDLYDISGRKIKSLLGDTKQTTGRYKLPVDVSNLSNGIYVYTIKVDGQVYAQKLTVAR